MSRPKKWRGAALESLRIDYEHSPMNTTQIAAKHKTSRGRLTNLAAEHQWIRRRPASIKAMRRMWVERRATKPALAA